MGPQSDVELIKTIYRAEREAERIVREAEEAARSLLAEAEAAARDALEAKSLEFAYGEREKRRKETEEAEKEASAVCLRRWCSAPWREEKTVGVLWNRILLRGR